MKRRLIHMVQYSADDHITCMEEQAFWRKDGYIVEIDYRGPVWLLKVYEVC